LVSRIGIRSILELPTNRNIRKCCGFEAKFQIGRILTRLLAGNIPMDPYHHWKKRSFLCLVLSGKSFNWSGDVQIEAFELIRPNNRS
jgi:hypothetical protein